ncbi:MAG: alpha/beta hydrolase, partial [Caulobacteraceae bacterium]
MAFLDFGPSDRPVDLVFLHANGFNALTYRRILAQLAGGARILAPDLRGHGRTDLATITEGRVSWHDLRDDLLAFMTALDLTGVVLGGHSMGATTSLLAAAEAPGRVRALALFDPVIGPGPAPASEPRTAVHGDLIAGAGRRRRTFPSRAAAFEAYRGRGAFRGWPEAMLADYVADGFRDASGGGVELACDPAWEASSYASHGHDSWEAFERSAAPIRIWRAAEGSTFRPDRREAALTASGRVTVETIPGTSHFLPMERP